ncbi:MAG: hypothetical protein ACI8RD_002820 [Bacillariaceae sp.]
MFGATHFSFFTTIIKDKARPKMRLYDQRSSTTIISDSKKWVRPTNFLPDEKENIVENSDTKNEKELTVTGRIWKENCDSETTSASASIEISKIYKHHTIYDDFRFDIDEDQETSMHSSSTLSTHSTLQHVTNASYNSGYKIDFLNSDPVAEYVGAESDVVDFSRSPSKNITKKSYQSPVKESSVIDNHYLLGNYNGDSSDSDEFYTPKLTLTESSEDSEWLDFQGFGIKNPFRAKPNNEKALLRYCQHFHETSPVKSLPRSNNKASPSYNINEKSQKAPIKSPSLYEGTWNYTKYLTSIIQGIPVADVSKAMEEDLVDPSIISLVLAASKARRSV